MMRLGLILLACLVWTPVVAADEEAMARREKIHKMMRKAEELHHAGRHEEAEKVIRKVRAMEQKADRRHGKKNLEEILEGLEHGLKAVRALGGHDELREHLEHAVHRVKERMEAERHKREDKEAGRRRDPLGQALRFAHGAMMEKDRRDLAEVVERFARDRKGKRENIIEILNYSAKLYREWGHPDRADICARAARELHGNRERQVARQQLEIMRWAFKAMMEAENRKAAEQMEHAIHAAELRLEGRRDEKAMHVYKTAPSRGQMVELLQYGGQLWRKFGNADRAEACVELAKRMNRKHKASGAEGTTQRLEQVEQRLARLEGSLEEIHKLLREMRRRK